MVSAIGWYLLSWRCEQRRLPCIRPLQLQYLAVPSHTDLTVRSEMEDATDAMEVIQKGQATYIWLTGAIAFFRRISSQSGIARPGGP